MEEIIKRNIKKLRKYCYRFRKKKKKNKKYKSQEHKTNTNSNNNNNNNNIHIISKKLNKEKEKDKDKELRRSHLKAIPRYSSKKQKIYSSIKNKRRTVKLKTLSQDEGKKIIIKLHKIKMVNQIKTENDNINNLNNEVGEKVPNIHEIKKELMHTSMNKIPVRMFDMHNGLTNMDINKTKNNKKKLIIRNTSLFKGKLEKFVIDVKNDKKDKIEIHDSLLLFKNKKLKKLELNNKLDIKNRKRNHSFINKSKTKKVNYSSKKTKIKLIESPIRKTDDYSNCNTYFYTNISNLPKSANEKNTNIIRKKSKNEI